MTFCSIQKNHASVTYANNEVVLKPLTQGAKTKVNGTPLTGEQKLEHNDRVMFGTNVHLLLGSHAGSYALKISLHYRSQVKGSYIKLHLSEEPQAGVLSADSELLRDSQQ